MGRDGVYEDVAVAVGFMFADTVDGEEFVTGVREDTGHIPQGLVAEDGIRRFSLFVCEAFPQRAQAFEKPMVDSLP